MDQGLGETSKNMGATVSSPLLGVHGSPALKIPSNKGRVPKPEERGGGGSLRSEKRAPVVLERWFKPSRPKTESLGSEEQGGGSEDCPVGAKEGSKD